ncbi:MAG: SPOR domain-containing protein [Gammaproteobacteria bacterium]|nr:SPOR domain-containing protein [Gammaproteobacteria bacterium]
MARDFKAKNRDRRGAGFGSSLSFITGLLIGLTVAAVVYFTRLCAPPPATDAPLATAPMPPAAETPPAPEVVLQEDHSALAPPSSGTAADFEFYKILPEIEVGVPASEPAVPAPAPDAVPPPAPEAATAYLLQVGSFQNFADADQAKAQLALQGITSRIQRVVVGGSEVWFRVQVGPYTALQDVQNMRTRLMQAGANVVVLKIGGNGGQP